jgi:hypothetical protein
MLVTVIVLAVLLAIALCILLALALAHRRSAALHNQFGNEYDRAVDERGSRRDAEHELAERTQRHDQLQIRPLDAMQREAFAASWRSVQARFVDEPREAVADADGLVHDVMTERGYPMGDFERQSADLSVDHSDVVDHYRAAHDIRTRDADGEATTEELRAAMVHYRGLFDSLLSPAPAKAGTARR